MKMTDILGMAARVLTAAVPVRNPTPAPAAPSPFTVTARIAAELIDHEAIVREAYRDSKGIWTWGVGVTDASGHRVGRYRDNPQSIARCLEIYIWLLNERYAPAVRAAFAGHTLTEAQFAAALSFHYNTGAIGRASWVRLWKAGDIDGARRAFMEWRKPPEIVERRQKECDLFFDGRWSGSGKATVWPVRKPSYRPDWGNGVRIDVTAELQALLG
jgi:GH24 family phage-related lysozyme (muramidase)